MKKAAQTKLAFIFGTVFIVVLLIIALFVPCPTRSQMAIFKTVLSLASAGIAAIIPGFFEFKYQKVVSAGGAMGVLALVYLFNPATLITGDDCSSPFSVSVFVHGEGGRGDYPSLDGTITLDLNNNRLTQSIDKQGKVTFVDISLDFKGTSLPFYVDIKGYEAVHPDSFYILDGSSVYIEIKRDQSLATLAGTVRDGAGNFLSGVTLRIQNITVTTDNFGYFQFEIPRDQQQEKQTLYVIKDGYYPKDVFVYPGTGIEINLILTEK